jgi:hypothetical protein
LFQFPETKDETVIDKVVLTEFALGTLAGIISYTAAILTTFVETAGFWRYFWLTVCIAAFACACCLIVLGCQNFGKRSYEGDK